MDLSRITALGIAAASAFVLMACKPAAQTAAPPASRAPATELTAEEVDKLEQDRERQGRRATDGAKMRSDAMRIQEKSAARAERERQRLTTEAEKPEGTK
jgi:PBP1b-binding outer membrane lipoprotein LpoB